MPPIDSNVPVVEKLKLCNAIAVDISSTDHQFARPAYGLYVGVGSDIVLDMFGEGSSITFKSVPSGTFLKDIVFSKVKKSGTTASSMVAFF